MALYLVFATRDLRDAVSATGTAFYLPFRHVAVVSYEGSADALARRLDIDRSDGPGAPAGAPVGALCRRGASQSLRSVRWPRCDPSAC